MAVSNIELIQTNVDECELLAIHNPLTFIVEAAYTGTAPEACTCLVYSNSVLLGTYKMIPYSDFLLRRRFVFVGDAIIRSFMEDFTDELITEKSLTKVKNITKNFQLVITCDAISRTVDFTALHGAVQFGEKPSLKAIEQNSHEIYIGGENSPVYIYFYNPFEGSTLTINTPFYDDAAFDFDEEIFYDNDYYSFKI